MRWLRQIGLAVEERAVETLASCARRWSSKWREMPPHLATGEAGERAALFYLRRKGYVVVARRWSSGEVNGDIDLIAWSGATLCFVEVKTRTAHDQTPAEAAVDRSKRNYLRRMANAYLRHLPQDSAPPVRFDIVSVYLLADGRREFEHFENAFPLNARSLDT
jgi:putative endonuclease